MVIALRPATQADAATCAAILNDWIDETSWMPRVHPHEDVERYYRETVLPDRSVVIAETPQHPCAGFMAMDDSGCITALYCRARGQGVGNALLTHAKTLRPDWTLWTFQANDAAQRFYLREGFVAVKTTAGDDEEGLPDILYEWSHP